MFKPLAEFEPEDLFRPGTPSKELVLNQLRAVEHKSLVLARVDGTPMFLFCPHPDVKRLFNTAPNKQLDDKGYDITRCLCPAAYDYFLRHKSVADGMVAWVNRKKAASHAAKNIFYNKHIEEATRPKRKEKDDSSYSGMDEDEDEDEDEEMEDVEERDIAAPRERAADPAPKKARTGQADDALGSKSTNKPYNPPAKTVEASPPAQTPAQTPKKTPKTTSKEMAPKQTPGPSAKRAVETPRQPPTEPKKQKTPRAPVDAGQPLSQRKKPREVDPEVQQPARKNQRVEDAPTPLSFVTLRLRVSASPETGKEFEVSARLCPVSGSDPKSVSIGHIDKAQAHALAKDPSLGLCLVKERAQMDQSHVFAIAMTPSEVHFPGITESGYAFAPPLDIVDRAFFKSMREPGVQLAVATIFRLASTTQARPHDGPLDLLAAVRQIEARVEVLRDVPGTLFDLSSVALFVQSIKALMPLSALEEFLIQFDFSSEHGLASPLAKAATLIERLTRFETSGESLESMRTTALSALEQSLKSIGTSSSWFLLIQVLLLDAPKYQQVVMGQFQRFDMSRGVNDIIKAAPLKVAEALLFKGRRAPRASLSSELAVLVDKYKPETKQPSEDKGASKSVTDFWGFMEAELTRKESGAEGMLEPIPALKDDLRSEMGRLHEKMVADKTVAPVKVIEQHKDKLPLLSVIAKAVAAAPVDAMPAAML